MYIGFYNCFNENTTTKFQKLSIQNESLEVELLAHRFWSFFTLFQSGFAHIHAYQH